MCGVAQTVARQSPKLGLIHRRLSTPYAEGRHLGGRMNKRLLCLAVAGALVLYDRLLQHGRFADRPVGSRGPIEALPPTGHGAPRFRKTIPPWLHADAKKP